MGYYEKGVTSTVQLQWRMTYFEKPTYVTNVHLWTSNFFIFKPSLQFYSVQQIKVQLCNDLFPLFLNFLTCAFFRYHIRPERKQNSESFLLEELTGEGDEISLPTRIAQWRRKSSQLFPENKYPFDTQKYRCPPGSHF